jgi:hypothetical protein
VSEPTAWICLARRAETRALNEWAFARRIVQQVIHSPERGAQPHVARALMRSLRLPLLH